MIFKQFEETDIVTGRTTRVASGFWPGEVTNWSQSLFVDDFWDLTSSAYPLPSFGATFYDVRRTMYYANAFPSITQKKNTDPYFSVTYGHIGGSGSFIAETSSIMCNPTKAVYTQYKNMLLGTSDLDGKFSFRTGSDNGTTDALDIFVLACSNYKMKDRLDEGMFQVWISGSKGLFTYIDDSTRETQIKTVYNLISGSLERGIASGASYEGLGLFYPQNGLVVLNANKLNYAVGLNSNAAGGFRGFWMDGVGPFCYYDSSSMPVGIDYCWNHKVLIESLRVAGGSGAVPANQMKVRKSEYVPARHYFVRVKNRDFNYSNNPTYVYDGNDGVHAKGTIYNSDFIDNPRTYITTVGLYNDSNELVAVAKLSRPAVKSFDNELLIKCRLDF